MKKYLLISFFLFFFPIVFSQTFISEIDFLNDEFIEIYSDENLNFSQSFFIDESLNKNHTFNLIQKKNSNFILLVSDNFLSNNNLDDINSTIYSNRKSTLGYYGLKNSGESFTIIFNESFNLSFIKNSNLYLLDNETLNFNFVTQNFFNYNKSIGEFNILQDLENDDNQDNDQDDFNCENILFNINLLKDKNKAFTEKIKFDFNSNVDNEFEIEYWIENYNGEIVKEKIKTENKNKKSFSKIYETNLFLIKANFLYKNCKIYDEILTSFFLKKNTEIENNECDYKFEILTKKNISENKIEYKLETNAEDFTQIYWIEDFLGNIILNKKNSTNDNWRVYTPKNFTKIFNIKGELYTKDNCQKNISLYHSFFSKTFLENNSYIKIFNKTKFLEFEIYRGDINKYNLDFFLDDKLFKKIHIKEKFSKYFFKIDKIFLEDFSKIKILGLDLEKNFSFEKKIFPKNLNVSEKIFQEKKNNEGKKNLIIVKSNTDIIKDNLLFIFSFILVLIISIMIIKW